MGNEASRMSPTQSGMGSRVGTPTGTNVPASPRTPSSASTSGAWRSKSFSLPPPHPLDHVASNPKMDRTIQRMDRVIRKRVRGGITYNMKLLIRGEKGTGKTSLFHRLKGEPIPMNHESTPQLQSATINWNFRVNSEESVKCEVWDVVDKGFSPTGDDEGDDANRDTGEPHANPFELGALQNGGALASSSVMATGNVVNGNHMVATVDASTVDVYHETHGVIFLLDVTKWHTLEYVRQQLEKVPVHIPTLVLGNFRDFGHQRKIFKEDIQELLYGNSDRSHRQAQLRRPHELLYFECSLLNCYGLKALHQYFGIPFLQLKLATIRQQVRIVEGEFAHLKHDLQAKISEQRYVDYVEHIKATGSDIRTGRRGIGTPRAQSSPQPANSENRNDDVEQSDQMRRTSSSVSNSSDVIVDGAQHDVEQELDEANSPSDGNGMSIHQQDLDDLPARNNSVAAQVATPLKMTHSASTSETTEQEPSVTHQATEETQPSDMEIVTETVHVSPSAALHKDAAEIEDKANNSSRSPVRRPRKMSVDETMNLEDFQVPKLKSDDLDDFYSDEESDTNEGVDDDVIVAPVGGLKKMISGVSHKQLFLDSDSSDSEENAIGATRGRQQQQRQRSPRRRLMKQGKQATKSSIPPSPPRPSVANDKDAIHADSAPSKPLNQSKSKTNNTKESQHKEALPAVPSTNTTPSPPPRTPSPRNKIDSGRTQIYKLTNASIISADSSSTIAAISPVSAESPVTTIDVDASDVVSASDNEKQGDEVETSINEVQPEGQPETNPSSGRIYQQSNRDTSFESRDPAKAVIPSSMEATDVQQTSDIDDHQDIRPDERNIKPLNSHSEDDSGNEDDGVVTKDVEGFFSDSDKEAHELVKELGEQGTARSDAIYRHGPSQAQNAVELKSQPQEVLVSDDTDDEGKVGSDQDNDPITTEPSLPRMYDQSELSADNTEKREGAADQNDEDFAVAGSLTETSNFFSDEDSDDVNPTLPVETILQPVTPDAHEKKGRPGMLMSDDDESEDEAVPIIAGASVSAQQHKDRIAVNDVNSDEGSYSQRTSITPAKKAEKSLPANDLEAFLNESGSDVEDDESSYVSIPASPARKKASRQAFMRTSDDDEDEEVDEKSMNDRFASYSQARKSKSIRRQQREELRQMSVAFDTTQFHEDIVDDRSTPISVAALGNTDVLAAIRQAQEDAMRMFPSASSTTQTAIVKGDEEQAQDNDKRRRKSKKKSHKEESTSKTKGKKSRKSSSRSKRHVQESDDDGHQP